MQKANFNIRPVESSDLTQHATVTLPDGLSPVQLGSGMVTRIISTGGGMAVIYEIWNPELEVKRAIKLLRPDHTRESEERFQTEMKICAKLHHPNIVDIYAVGSWNGLPYIEMEEIEGVTVEKLIADSGHLPLEVVTSIGIMVGRALNYAHNQKYLLYGKEYHGIIHRDLKPSNIMVCKNGNVKLMDFGIATPTNASMHTMQGTVVGTLQYLSPEQLEGREIDVRVDIYALGIVLYEMLTGVRAFPENNLAKLVPDKLNNHYVPLTGYCLKMPVALRELVHTCMRFDKERRISSALVFLRCLSTIHKRLTVLSPEQVMLRFMQSPVDKAVVVTTRSTLNARPVIFWLTISLVLLCAVSLSYWYILKIRNARIERKDVRSAEIQKIEVMKSEIVLPKDTSVVQMAVENHSLTGRENDSDSGYVNFKEKKSRNESFVVEKAALQMTKQNEVQEMAIPNPQSGLSQSSINTQKELSVSPLVFLERKYGTKDALTIFVSEVTAGNFVSALGIYRYISPQDAETKKAIIYRIRALQGSGRIDEAKELILRSDESDGELCVEKALVLFSQKDYGGAQALLGRASSMPSMFLEQQVYRGRLLYAKGLCLSAQFDLSSSAAKKKDAMAAWYDVKTFFRMQTDHEYFKKADEEIRRINKAEIVE